MKCRYLLPLLLLPVLALAEESLVQKTLNRHSAMKSLHVVIDTDVKAAGWKEKSELWVVRPGSMAYTSSTQFDEGPPLETKLVSQGGNTTVWTSRMGPDPESEANVYYKLPTPPDVIDLEGAVRFGPQETILRLLSGDTARFIHKRFLRALGPNQVELRTDSKERKLIDQVTFDSAGLVTKIEGIQDGKMVAEAKVQYLEVDQPIDPKVFMLTLPAGAKELQKE